MKAIGRQLGFGILGMGLDPKTVSVEGLSTPRGHYAIMHDHISASQDGPGTDIMYRTCTVQVN